MKKLFATPLDKLYSIATIITLVMIIFPPSYNLIEFGPSYEYSRGVGSYFAGYDFVFNLSDGRLIDLGRLSLQFIALGSVVITIKRVITN